MTEGTESDDEKDAELGGEEAMLAESEEVQEREFYGHKGEGENRSSEHLWLISYSDFMTIMMIFFLAMYGYSHLTQLQQTRKVDRFDALATDLKEKLKDDIRVVEERDKVTVELGEGILFRSGRADLNPAAAKTLAALSSSLTTVEGDIIVEGHTDNVPMIGGPYKSNWELSAARAFSVIQSLKSAGVPPGRLAAWGFGENRPVVGNDSPENRKRNRRIDVVILKKKIQGA